MPEGNEGIDSQNTTTDGLPEGGKKWASKYASPEELEQGYLNILTNDTRLSAENDQLRRRIEAITPMLETQTRQPNGSAQTHLDALAEATSTDKNQLAEAFYAVAREAVKSEMQPLYQEAGARAKVAATIPDFEKFSPEVYQFVNSNPEVRAEVERARQSGAFEAAQKYAYNEWRASQPVNNGRTSASGEDQAQARLDSATLGGSAGGTERAGIGRPSTGGSDPVNVLQAAIARSKELKSKGVHSRALAEQLAAYVFELQDKMLEK